MLNKISESESESYKKICCIGRIGSHVREIKTKIENIL